MRIAINKLQTGVTTLGFGRRVGIWTQGCSIQCPGCVNKDTWAFDRSGEIEVAGLLDSLADALRDADGVTVSGGEPCDQPEALCELLAGLRDRCVGDILLFSGYTWPRLRARFPQVLDLVDVVVSGPYVEAAGQSRGLRGSDNQEFHRLTPLARARYSGSLDDALSMSRPALDLSLGDDELWMAGIPRPRDMERFRRILASQGYACHGSDEMPAPTTPC